MAVDFIGIGGQRCGTTWLYHQLNRHPGVRFPAGKEVHYWDSRPDDGPEPWLAMFPDRADGAKQGDITPAYAILPRTVISTIHATVPDVRLFLSIRNPMERAWSAALYLLGRCQMDSDEASDAWFSDVLRSWRCRAKSTFSETIVRWDEAFSTEQLLVVFYDDIVSQPAEVLRSLADHIGVDPEFYDETDSSLASRRGIITSGRRDPSPRLRELLFELHEQEIKDLEVLFERDFSHWVEWAQRE